MPDTLIVGVAAVAERDQQPAESVEDERAPVVVELRLIDPQQLARARRIRRRSRIRRGGHAPLGDHGLMIRRHVERQSREVRRSRYRLRRIRVDETVGLIARVKREPEQPALVETIGPGDAELDEPVGDVEKHRRLAGREIERVYLPDLIDDEQPVRPPGRGGTPVRRDEPFEHGHESYAKRRLTDRCGYRVGTRGARRLDDGCPLRLREHRRSEGNCRQSQNPHLMTQALERAPASAERR